jgi:hypothetical protein
MAQKEYPISMQVRFLPSNVVPGAVVHTRQRDETENDRDISRIVEIPATLAEIFRKTVFRKRRIPFPRRRVLHGHHRPGQVIAASWRFRLASGLDAAGTPVCMTLQQFLPGQPQSIKSATLNNRPMRALSATDLYWRISLSSNDNA